MGHTVGEGDVRMFIQLDGKQYEVVPAKRAAILMGYSRTHMCRLCDEGKVLAHKVGGVWWIQIWQSKYLQKD